MLKLRRPLTLIAIIALSLIALSLIGAGDASAEGEIVVIRGTDVPLSARLLQNGTYGEPVPDQIIEFHDEILGVYLGSALTNQNGYATITWSLPSDHPLGVTPINATFAGNASLALAPSSQWAFPYVVSNTQLHLQTSPEPLHPGDDLSFSITLQDDLGVPITDAIVTVSIGTSELAISTTNTTGHAAFTFECNSSWSDLGPNSLTVRYEQDLVNFHSRSEITFQVDVEQIQPSITIESVVPNTLNLTDSIQIQLSVESFEGPIQNSLLEVYLDNQVFETITTDLSGIAGLTLDIDSRFQLGQHRLRVEFNGTERYTTAYAEINFDVESSISIVITEPEFAILSIENEFSIEAYDSLHRPIENAIVTIYDSMTHTDFTKPFPSGQMSAIIAIQFEGSVGPRSLMLTISGNEFITNNTLPFEITIWSQPELALVESNILGYASPLQEIFLQIHLNGSEGGMAEKVIEVLDYEGTIDEILVTDTEGFAHFSILAPETEGDFSFILYYPGLELEYELPSILTYRFTVSRKIPAMVQLNHYKVNPPTQEILVQFVVRGLNGTLLQGVGFTYTWIGLTITTISQANGIIDLHLSIPNHGTYLLYYETKESATLMSYSGNITIIITEADAMAAQGIGIPGLAISVFLSIGLVGVPIVYRRYMIG